MATAVRCAARYRLKRFKDAGMGALLVAYRGYSGNDGIPTPYTSTVDVAAFRFPIVPVGWLMEDRFESLARIGAITEPLLVMHGDRDYTIPQRFGRRLFEAANEPKQAFWAQGAGHSDVFDKGGFDAALAFIGRVMKLSAATEDVGATPEAPC